MHWIGKWIGYSRGRIPERLRKRLRIVLYENYLPTSYLFSPFVPNGNIYSLIIALIPRILIGITPYFVYRYLKNKTGLILAGAIGSLTNTIFVLGGIFLLFSNVYNGNIQLLLASVISTNSIAEMIISAILTVAIIPALEKVRK